MKRCSGRLAADGRGHDEACTLRQDRLLAVTLLCTLPLLACAARPVSSEYKSTAFETGAHTLRPSWC